MQLPSPATCVSFVAFTTVRLSVYERPVGPRFANDVFVVNNLAYVTDSHDGLQIVDVSSPSTPLLLGGIKTLGRAESVGGSENIAYVAANGLWTFRPLDSQGSDGTHRVLWKRVR